MAAEPGFDIVIAAGGDGPLNEVINGLANEAIRSKLGIIPYAIVYILSNYNDA